MQEIYNTARSVPGLPSITRKIERWFLRHQRPLPWRRDYDPYGVWVSEVMLQQTRMEVVLGYYERFLARFPTIESLAAASEDEVMAMWSGLGYYSRARKLREGAIDVCARFGGKLPASVDELQTIAGIGRYTAGAIASIAHQVKAPIVDGNVARILSRLMFIREPLGSPALMREAWRRAEQLVSACGEPRDFNQGLMELGALICKPAAPACNECPLRGDCMALVMKRVGELPLPKLKRDTQAMRVALYLITDGSGRVLMRRGTGKLMGAMFHLPHGDSSLLEGEPLDVTGATLLGSFRHTITHRRIEFQLFAAELAPRVRETNGEYAWIDPRSMADIPHPSYVRKALSVAGI